MDSLIDWLIDWLTDWLIDWLIDWQNDWLIHRMIDWLIGWLIDWLIVWLMIAYFSSWFQKGLAGINFFQLKLITKSFLICIRCSKIIANSMCVFYKQSKANHFSTKFQKLSPQKPTRNDKHYSKYIRKFQVSKYAMVSNFHWSPFLGGLQKLLNQPTFQEIAEQGVDSNFSQQILTLPIPRALSPTRMIL